MHGARVFLRLRTQDRRKLGGDDSQAFLWILNTFSWEVTLRDLDATDSFMSNIVDPTSLVEHSGKSYLITAESKHPWFMETQDYITFMNELVYD
jgi:hypothetical protein